MEGDLRELLRKFRKGEIDEEEIFGKLRLDYQHIIEKNLRPDLYRDIRTGIAEIIYGPSKTAEDLPGIIESFLEKKKCAIISRTTPEQRKVIREYFVGKKVSIKEDRRNGLVRIYGPDYTPPPDIGAIGIITAGTSDITVAEEAAAIAEESGCSVIKAYDVGVAGLHRLFGPLREMINKKVRVIIVAAGMEGTLPGIVASLVDIPVIGLPTSTGYGHGGKGEGALTTMLQSCSPGLAVVNIDNGVGAAALAVKICRIVDKAIKDNRQLEI